ncbi:MAG: chromate transporter [Solobacterium sp.]|jgi:chromate transporter|nr:chromate transporter [Solobacterium sp.]
MICAQLFIVFFEIGLFSFGGGYAAMPLIQNLAVDTYHWLTMAEYADLTTIAEMTPGPIGINAATFVGQKMAGLAGAIVCTLGFITPSLIIVLILSILYQKYKKLPMVQGILGQLRPAVVALIGGAALTLLLLALFGSSSFSGVSVSSLHIIELGLFLVSFFLLRKYKVSPIAIIFGTALVGTLLYMVF